MNCDSQLVAAAEKAMHLKRQTEKAFQVFFEMILLNMTNQTNAAGLASCSQERSIQRRLRKSSKSTFRRSQRASNKPKGSRSLKRTYVKTSPISRTVDRRCKQFLKPQIKDNYFLQSLDLTPKLLDNMLDAATLMKYPKGTSILEQGCPNDSFFILKNGIVEVLQNKEVKISPCGIPGAVYGEISLMKSDRLATATVTTVADSEFWVIDRKAFRTTMAEHLTHSDSRDRICV